MELNLIEVGVAIIMKDNKLFIGKRSSNVPFTGLWEFPGGKLEENETPQECIKRELKEELNVESVVKDLLHVYILEVYGKLYKLHCYFTDIDETNLKLNVHDETKWVEIEKCHTFPLLKSNYKILDKLKFKLKIKV